MSKKQKKEIVDSMRVISLGDSGTGKTSIINRYAKNIFEENPYSTIGINFIVKKIKFKDGNTISLKLIDTGGQEKYRALGKSYIKNADAVLFVFAFNDKDSFDNIEEWINLFKKNHSDEDYIPMYLVGNKTDLERKVSNDLINQFKEVNKGFKYYETSTKENKRINELFEELAKDLYKILVKEEGNKRNNSRNKLILSTNGIKKSNKGNCVCSSTSEFTKNKD